MGDLTINLDSLISTGIGAFIGSVLTLAATFIAHYLERNKSLENDKKMILGFLQGVHDELETLWDLYNYRIGAMVESLRNDQALEFYWPISQDYFTIYVQNAHLIGQIKENDLRKQIVLTYTQARGLVDSHRMNNELLHKYEQLALLHQETNDEIHLQQAQASYNVMVEYGASLKESRAKLKESMDALLRSLRKLGVLNETA
jgi:hypothetical protein